MTKVGVVRDQRGDRQPAHSPEALREQVYANLRRHGLDVLDVVNLRTLAGIDDRASGSETVTPQFEALAELGQQGLIRRLGLSTVTLDQLAEAHRIAAVVCVQNFLQHRQPGGRGGTRGHGEQHIAYVPYSRSVASPRCSPTCWSRSPSGSVRARWRSPNPGCSTRPT